MLRGPQGTPCGRNTNGGAAALALGEHTDEIVRMMGISAERIAELRASGTIQALLT